VNGEWAGGEQANSGTGEQVRKAEKGVKTIQDLIFY